MKKGLHQKTKSKTIPVIFPILTAIILLALLMIILLRSCDGAPSSNNENVADSTTATVEKNTDSISIPGYEGLTLRADSKKQDLCLSNPAQNTCYFQIALFLEDGTLLWQSELIEPGKTSKPIILEKELEKGTYPKAVLHYSCFEMNKELTQLNGAEIKVTLRVK